MNDFDALRKSSAKKNSGTPRKRRSDVETRTLRYASFTSDPSFPAEVYLSYVIVDGEDSSWKLYVPLWGITFTLTELGNARTKGGQG